MNLAGIDLNLLLVFDAVMSERHVTRAGQKIGMSQPAMSNALSRLRHHLNDQLFVRGPDGMRPTPRALELVAPIRAALETLEVALDPATFDPQTDKLTYSIGTNDYAVTILMPQIANRLHREAPGINIRLVPSAGRSFDMLDAQEIDFGLSAFGDIPERFGSLVLVEDEYVLMMRADHPLATGRLTLARYAAARHLLMSPRGDAVGFVDRALAKNGLTRQVAMVVNSFSSAALLLARTDMVLAAPSRVAETLGALYGLTSRAAPFEGPREFSSATLVWHARLADHPAHTWFRNFLARVAQEAP